MDPSVTSTGRRRFLKLLAGSPLLAYGALSPGLVKAISRGGIQDDDAIPTLDDMYEVLDFEPLAKRMLLPEHWAYLATGVDDDSTLRANREGFNLFALRMRRLVDVSNLDMSVEIFGKRWDTPIALCPVAALKGFHTEGAKGAARAASARGHLQMLSSTGTSPLEEVNEAYGEPIWYQNYGYGTSGGNLALIKRVESAGCPAMVYTLDIIGGRNTVTSRRMRSANRSNPSRFACNIESSSTLVARYAQCSGSIILSASGLKSMTSYISSSDGRASWMPPLAIAFIKPGDRAP